MNPAREHFIPLAQARLCLDCNTISNVDHYCQCGSAVLMPLASWIGQVPEPAARLVALSVPPVRDTDSGLAASTPDAVSGDEDMLHQSPRILARVLLARHHDTQPTLHPEALL